MNIFLVSDDTYFLLGMQNLIANLPSVGAVTFLNASKWDVKQNQLNPALGDIVLMNVSNIHLRRRLIHLPVMSACRLVIMVRLNGMKPFFYKTMFPQIIAWNTQPQELIGLLSRVVRYTFNRHQIPGQTKEIFDLLVNEHSLADISGRMQMSEKYIYAVKRRLLNQFGLGKCNSSVASVFCHEIFCMDKYVGELSPAMRARL
ncbi:hypothetical protein [Klebsiella oxytoca]|uniref:hypothetical protein n=1 Tax=Klebsiella oxytoca TaxID=571 RepID=UPI001B31D1FE|nr:hypothetical protein [Klebsiella oxytoca]EJM1003865.1 hypothetical protein [Klebsiella oxytoca]EKQ7242550.1 hypothetical protein [Klebsiella oxytoca]WBD78225.1 hypothetical protein OEE41_03865 [Klebsiella oxytoca]HBC8616437.1 hypothetical protein [Klebsiella oxytoca]